MRPHRVEIGDRYSDDSGWERRIAVDMQNLRLEIEIGGAEMSVDAAQIPWLLESIGKAYDLVIKDSK